MGFLNPGYDDDYRIANMPGTTDIPAPGALEGALTAIPKGIVTGAAKVGDLLSDVESTNPAAFNAAVGPLAYGLMADAATVRAVGGDVAIKNAQAATQVAAEWGATGQDPRVTGTVGRILAGTSEGLTIGAAGAAVAGPWGAAGLLGATEGYSSYKQGEAQGLSPEASKEQAILTGAFSAAGALLPMKFGTTALASILGGGAANIGLGAAQRGLTGQVLADNGYPEQAKQYRIFDGEAMAADAILGGTFGAMGHFTHPDSPRTTNPADVDAALAVSAEDHFNRSAPGIPTDPAAATAHASTLADAMRGMLDGDLPDVPPARAQEIVDHVIPDPAQDFAPALHEAALEDLPGYDAAAADVPRVELPSEETPPPRVEPEPAPKATGEPAQPADVPLDPYSQDQLDHLVHNYGDAPYLTDDGREVTIRQMADEMQQQRNEARKFGALHEIAAACAARNGL